MVKRFWFEFSKSDVELPIGISRGCGLSAENYEDALELLREKVFNSSDIPEIEIIVENIDISTLDKQHILTNIGDVTMRGIWFPLGY